MLRKYLYVEEWWARPESNRGPSPRKGDVIPLDHGPASNRGSRGFPAPGFPGASRTPVLPSACDGLTSGI